MGLFRLFAAVVLFSSLTAAFAQNKKTWEVDDGGMPRCLYPTNKKFGGVLFVWPQYKQYQREIFAIPLDRFTQVDVSQRHCFFWQSLLSKAASMDLSTYLLKEGQKQVGSYKIPDKLQPVLMQIRRGGNIYRSEQSAKEYLQNHPIEDFEFRTNTDLSRKYGMGFAAEVFRAYLESKPQNQSFLTDFRAHVKAHAPMPRYENLKLIFAPGYMENPKESKVKTMLADLNLMGLESTLFDVNCTEDLFTNSAKIKAQMLKELSQGHNLIVGGASKGVPEVIDAMAQLQDIIDNPPPGYGHIEAVLMISGTIRGSYLADWILKKPVVWAAIEALKIEAKKTGLDMGDVMPGLRTQSQSFLNQYIQNWKGHLPQNPKYIAIVGTVSNFGFAPADWMKQVQKLFLDSHIFPKHSSNDGFLEYPANTIPQGWLKNYVEVPFDASHEIFDGSFDGLPLGEQQTRQQILAGLFATLFK